MHVGLQPLAEVVLLERQKGTLLKWWRPSVIRRASPLDGAHVEVEPRSMRQLSIRRLRADEGWRCRREKTMGKQLEWNLLLGW